MACNQYHTHNPKLRRSDIWMQAASIQSAVESLRFTKVYPRRPNIFFINNIFSRWMSQSPSALVKNDVE